MRSKGSQPHAGPRAPVTEREVHTIAGLENHQGLSPGEMEDCCRPRHAFKGTEHRLICIQTLTISAREGIAAGKVPGTCREELNRLASGRALDGQLSLGL